MKPGNILAFKINNNTTNFFSKAISLISRFTVGNWLPNNDSYSHVSILAEELDMHYELTWPRGGKNRIKWDKYDVYQVVHNDLTNEKRQQILEFCRTKAHKYRYDWLCIITFGLLRLSNNASVCSRFVGDAYAAVGINLRKKSEKLLSPNEIAHNPNVKIKKI
ncbi:MAG: hypothetical protein HWN81_00010 [Candidatus Lokiarchaeota archaeon]|nr:hypothetical protein [Candidatus Lokiarchaeota archaeon]